MTTQTKGHPLQMADYLNFKPSKSQLANGSHIPLRHQGKVVAYIVHNPEAVESYLLRKNVNSCSWLYMFSKTDPSISFQESHIEAADDHLVNFIVLASAQSGSVLKISLHDWFMNMKHFRHAVGDQLCVPLSKFTRLED